MQQKKFPKVQGWKRGQRSEPGPVNQPFIPPEVWPQPVLCAASSLVVQSPACGSLLCFPAFPAEAMDAGGPPRR